eukprot:8854420-Heterocapsa_arctica.AAC.1
MTTIHEETKRLIEKGFKSQEKAFDDEHVYSSKNRKKLEDDIKDVYALIKEGKRKSDEMDADAEVEHAEE